MDAQNGTFRSCRASVRRRVYVGSHVAGSVTARRPSHTAPRGSVLRGVRVSSDVSSSATFHSSSSRSRRSTPSSSVTSSSMFAARLRDQTDQVVDRLELEPSSLAMVASRRRLLSQGCRSHWRMRRHCRAKPQRSKLTRGTSFAPCSASKYALRSKPATDATTFVGNLRIRALCSRTASL